MPKQQITFKGWFQVSGSLTNKRDFKSNKKHIMIGHKKEWPAVGGGDKITGVIKGGFNLKVFKMKIAGCLSGGQSILLV